MDKYKDAFDYIVAATNGGDGIIRELNIIKELIDKTSIEFNDKCNCIFDYNMLCDSISLECKKRNCYVQKKYNIYFHNGYPCISIGQSKTYVHILIGKLVYKRIRKGYVIHHKDFNKLNAMPDNLQLLTAKAHIKLHMTGNDFRTEEGKNKAIYAAIEKRKRKEITREKIEELLKEGKTKAQIAEYFGCGESTIYRRLGHKL